MRYAAAVLGAPEHMPEVISHPFWQDLYNSAISDKHYKREGAPGTVEHYSRQKTSLEVQLKAGYLHVGSLTMSQVQEIRHFLLGR
jgi:hypothetical protein